MFGNKTFAAVVLRWALLAAFIMTLLLYIPTPFAAYQPGIAIDTGPLVKAAEPDAGSRGALMLTTVKMSYPNFWTVISASWDQDIELFRKKDLLRGKTDKEYMKRQSVIMRDSQSDAIEAAYIATGTDYEKIPVELIVSDTEADSDLVNAEDSLRTGDTIAAVEGREVHSLEGLMEELERSAAGMEGDATAELPLSIVRDGKPMELVVKLETGLLSGTGGADGETAGSRAAHALKVSALSELRTIKAADPAKEITIESSAIGGPSAGLMFALQIIDEITPGDLTGGKLIAGTGTISPHGKIGEIGGVAHKIAAADKRGAQLFLVPKHNAEAARLKAAELGTAMHIVPVETLDDALAALGTER